MLVVSDMEEYKQLREQFLASAEVHENPDLLDDLKKLYRPVINSNRSYSQIKSLEELLRVLEKRGAVSYDNVGLMRHIAQFYIKDTDLDELVAKFQERNEAQSNEEDMKITLYNPDTVNHVRNVAGSISHQDSRSEKSSSTSSVQSSIGESAATDRIKDLVFLNLCERLGTNWREFARYLNVQEVDIDKIHKSHPKDTQKNTEKILNIYFSRTSPTNWKLPLLEALGKIRRPDLKELVIQLLYSENI